MPDLTVLPQFVLTGRQKNKGLCAVRILLVLRQMKHDPAQIFPCRIEGADPFRPAAILTELPVKTVQQLRRHEHRSPHLRRNSTRECRKIRLLLPADQDHGKVPRQTAEKEIAGTAVDDLFPVAEQIAERDFSVFRAGPDEQSFRQYLNIRHHVRCSFARKNRPGVCRSG